MVNYSVRAWRDGRGNAGITIGTVADAGGYNVEADFDVPEEGLAEFLSACRVAMMRALAAPGPLDELR